MRRDCKCRSHQDRLKTAQWPSILRRTQNCSRLWSRFSVLEKPFTWTIRVYYEDTDTCGIVYYANYLKFFERARTEWLRSVGCEQQQMADELGLRFVISRVECEFKLPAKLDDLIDVDVHVARLGSASMTFEQTARRGSAVLATARVRVGCIESSTLVPAPLPAQLRAAVERLPELNT